MNKCEQAIVDSVVAESILKFHSTLYSDKLIFLIRSSKSIHGGVTIHYFDDTIFREYHIRHVAEGNRFKWTGYVGKNIDDPSTKYEVSTNTLFEYLSYHLSFLDLGNCILYNNPTQSKLDFFVRDNTNNEFHNNFFLRLNSVTREKKRKMDDPKIAYVTYNEKKSGIFISFLETLFIYSKTLFIYYVHMT
jgi:hypothetical protein